MLKEPDQPVLLLKGPFTLGGASTRIDLEADLVLRWSPSLRIEFEGDCSDPAWQLHAGEGWTLESNDFKVPVLIREISRAGELSTVRGITLSPICIGEDSFQSLRFSLVNFPNYVGGFVQRETGGAGRDRLEMNIAGGRLQVDAIHEARQVAKLAKYEGGAVITHVGVWTPSSSKLSPTEAESLLTMLHHWFALLSGSRSGPLFPEGVGDSGEITWKQYGPWSVDRGPSSLNWFPSRNAVDLTDALGRFLDLWQQETWRDPLKYAISWYSEGNVANRANESRIIIAQVALELLSSVTLVEASQFLSRRQFKKLPTADRLRTLLDYCKIPVTMPGHLTSLRPLIDTKHPDGPGVVTKVRNALAHSSAKDRETMRKIAGEQFMECGQLALQYLELVLLALLGYQGHYSRRAWRGWKGEDEVVVPWRHAT